MNNMHVSDVHIKILFSSHLHDSKSALNINFKHVLQLQNSKLPVFLFKETISKGSFNFQMYWL